MSDWQIKTKKCAVVYLFISKFHLFVTVTCSIILVNSSDDNWGEFVQYRESLFVTGKCVCGELVQYRESLFVTGKWIWYTYSLFDKAECVCL